MAGRGVMSKAFGPTDSVADTLTTVGSAWQVPAFNGQNVQYTITSIRVAKGNVVNAKECAGFIAVLVDGVAGSPFAYAYGNGAGGATNSGNMAAEPVPCRIPISSGQTVTVKVLDAEVAKDVIVSLFCEAGKQGEPEYTLCAGGAGQDTTADTALTLTVNGKLVGPTMTPFKNMILRKIRIAGSGVVDAKAGSGKLVLTVAGHPVPLEFAFGNGPGGATLSGPAWADVIDNLAVALTQNNTIIAQVTTSEVMLSVSVSLLCD